jgi:hypothetical protein
MAATEAIVFHVPENPEWLQAFGRVSVVHTHLDHILRMLLKSLAGVSIEAALLATENEASAALRDRAKKIARQQLGEGAALLNLQALLERCKRVTTQRNDWIHTVIASDWLDTEAMRYREGRPSEPLPTVEQLDCLTEEMQRLIRDINSARLGGWLAEALSKRTGAGSASHDDKTAA